MCNLCANPLKDSKYYEVICRDARDHDKEERVDELQNHKEKKDEEARRAEEHDKEKKIEAYKAELRDLDDDELEEVLESLRAELDEMKEQLNPETDEERIEKKASLENIGFDSSLITKTKYHVLTLKEFDHNTAPGDKLLMRLGSRDDDSVGDSSGDELLQKLGSTD